MNGLKRLIQRFRARDRRRSDRQESPQLAAYFWTNSQPIKQVVKDVSPSGFYLVTEERWYPGTLVMMTLQTEDELGETGNQAVAVQSKAVRWGDDGVGLMFMLPEKGTVVHADDPATHAANQKTLGTFLQRFLQPKGKSRN